MRFQNKEREAYTFPTTGARNIYSGTVSLEEKNPLKKGFLLDIDSNNSYKKSKGSSPVGLLISGDNFYKKQEWVSKDFIEILRSGRILIAKEDVEVLLKEGDFIKSSMGNWDKGTEEDNLGRVIRVLNNTYDVDLKFK